MTQEHTIYTPKYISKWGKKWMARCPNCGYEFKIELRCLRCGHTWIPHNPNKIPKVCPNPKCKSPYWNRPRQNKEGMHK